MPAATKYAGEVRRIVSTLFLLLVITAPTGATNGMKVIGVGPVQRSMGGASVALPLDSAVAVANPAGLAQLDRRVDIAATFFSPDVRYRATSTGGMVTYNDAWISSDAGPCVMPAAGLVVPLNSAWTFGLGAYGICGMGVDYSSNLYHNVTYTRYHQMRLAPALSYRLDAKTSIGAALDVGYALMDFKAGSPMEQPHKDGDAFGFGSTLGIFRQLNETIALGLAYETKQSFSDFEFSTPAGTDKLRLNQPQSVTAGLGVKATPRLRLGFDVSWIDWPQTVGKNLPAYTQNQSGATPWNMNWDPQWVYKLGLEYDLTKRTKVRLGYNYGKNPLDSSRAFENIAFPAITEHHLTAGLGIALNDSLSVNLGAMYAPKVSYSTANSAQFIDSARTEMSQYSIEAGIGYRF